jgi:serine/threonine protein kinase
MHALDTMEARKDLLRDLKPGNLLPYPREDGGEIVKLIDFGLAYRPHNPPGQLPIRFMEPRDISTPWPRRLDGFSKKQTSTR